ncbi:MAG: TAXI family TRAP transporter solute-binding subunit, partial [Rhodospirillaceae bacterium]|nr:TAXI family TRAP transporter solute-binding subunit [Rhodospirillaceae bacterium]
QHEISGMEIHQRMGVSLTCLPASFVGCDEEIDINEATIIAMDGAKWSWILLPGEDIEGSQDLRIELWTVNLVNEQEQSNVIWHHSFQIDTNTASGTVADLAALAGKGFSIGKRNSGTEGSNRHILAGLGLDPEAMFDLAFLGYGPSADALINGKIAGMSTPAGPPVSAVTRAFAALGEDITILSFTPGEIARANAGFDLWTPYTLAAGTYPGQETGVGTIAQPNFLGVRADVDDEAVYQITKSMHENLPFLNNIHKATRAISLESALSGLPVPLHPGAARYYQEQGLDIPGALLGG